MTISSLKKLFTSLFGNIHKKNLHKLGISETVLQQAKQGNSNAQLEIASRYYCAHDKKYLTKALYWLQKASDNQNADAMFSLATLYYKGKGMAKDLQLAHNLYKKSAELGQQKASKMLNLTTRDLLEQQAEQGDRNVILQYINHCVTSTLKIDDKKLIQWLFRVAQSGDHEAMLDIGNFYINGSPALEQDHQQAIAWLNKSAELDNDKAMHQLGYCYLKGHGATQNTQQAIAWFEKAAYLGNDKAMLTLASLYLTAEQIPQDYQQVHYWFSKAAKQNNLMAMQGLANLYQNGLGVKQSIEKMHYWQQQAASVKAQIT